MHNSLLPRRARLVTARVLLLGLLTAFALSANAEAPITEYRVSINDPTWSKTEPLACSVFAARVKGATNVNNSSYKFTGTSRHEPGAGCYVGVEPVSGTGQGFDEGPYAYSFRQACASGATPITGVPINEQCPASDAPMDANTSCLKYPGAAALAAADGWVREPRTFAYNVGANGIATITGKTPTGKDYTYAVDCYGKSRITDGDGKKLPAPTPSPAPDVKVDYPKCGVGNYAYTDETGLTSCSQNLPDRTLTDCGSANGGYVNGKAVCLPSNPAPGTAAAAAAVAQQKSDAAVAAGKATTAALTAAADALAAYKQAANAAASLPSSAAAAGSAATAYASAQQAALAAGLTVPTPIPLPGTPSATGTGGTGTGTENSGPVECGSPGKPKCAIDETGTKTPADMTEMNRAANTSVADAWDKIQAEINKVGPDAAEKKGLLDWGFTFSLPSSCSVYTLFLNVKIDFCTFQPIVHELMSLIWLGATMWICIGMVGATLRGKT